MNGSLMNVWGDMISVTGSFSAAFILFIHTTGSKCRWIDAG